MKKRILMLAVLIFCLGLSTAYAKGTYLNLPDNWNPYDNEVKLAGDVYNDNKPAKVVAFKSVKEAQAVYFNFAHDIIQISDKTITFTRRAYGTTKITTKNEDKDICSIKSAKLVKGKVVYVYKSGSYEHSITLSKHADGRYLMVNTNEPNMIDYYGNFSFLTRFSTIADLEKYFKSDKVLNLRAKQEVELREAIKAYEEKKAQKEADNKAFAPVYAKTLVNEKAPLQFEYVDKDNQLKINFQYEAGVPYVTIETKFSTDTDLNEKFKVSSIDYTPTRIYYMLEPLEGSKYLGQKHLMLFVSCKDRSSLNNLDFVQDSGQTYMTWNGKTVELELGSVDQDSVVK